MSACLESATERFSQTPMPTIDSFNEWNLRLLRCFFSEASKGEEVFFRVDREFLDQIGQDIGGDVGFLSAVRRGPEGVDPRSSIVDRVHYLVHRLRRKGYRDPGEFDPTYRDLHAPAYLPYLAALVRNNSEENGVGYYAALRRDLKLEQDFGTQQMAQIQVAWADLQKWTKNTNQRFGFFEVRILGGYNLIGVPRSQSILKPSDLEGLARVFVQAQVRPGHELTKSDLQLILDEARATAHIFTAGFQQALHIPDFEQPICAAIRAAYSDWDGTLSQRGSDTGNTGISLYSIGLSLAVVDELTLKVSPCWRIPAIQDVGEFQISHSGLRWNGQFFGTEGANSKPSISQETDFWEIAEKASITEQKFDLLSFGGDDTEPMKFQLSLRQHQLWILVPAYEEVTGNLELRESVLPGTGSAFLLAPPNSVKSLKWYLEREAPEHELICMTGLPNGWLFVRLNDCSSLTEEQRLLPDGADELHARPHHIHFVGGRSIRRGYSRMYLPYDLPIIVLDAPEGSHIICPVGVSIVEKEIKSVASHAANVKQVQFRQLKRFEIRLVNSKSASYNFYVRAMDGSHLGQAKLRVASSSGELVDTGGPTSLDKLGRLVASGTGLSGVLLHDLKQHTDTLNGFNLTFSELGYRVIQYSLKLGIREYFLDALAQSGSLNYNAARELLQRLIRETGTLAEPIFMLLEFRRCGYLEISTTHKGHISRVHSVKPTLFTLPSTCSGKPIWSVAGTLRIAHWKKISEQIQAWSVQRKANISSHFESWHLHILDEEEAIEACDQIGFQFAELPCMSIVNWSADLDVFHSEMSRNPMESIGRAKENAMRFNASKGLFTATPTGHTCELWKVRDLDTGMDNLYVLAKQERFAFVRDSRWGVWLALDEFAKWVSTLPEMDGVHPIPITYERDRGTLWLPARISPPAILERALILCSATLPNVLTLKKHAIDGEEEADRLSLSRSDGHHPVLSANRFYSEMAEGKWLAYQSVPEQIARVFAGKLGAVLDII